MLIQNPHPQEVHQKIRHLKELKLLLLKNYLEHNDPHICSALKDDLINFQHFHISRLENLPYWANIYDDKKILESYDLYIY